MQLLPSFCTSLLDIMCFQIWCHFRSLSKMMWQLSAELLIFSAQSFLQFEWQSEPPPSVNIFLCLQCCTPSAALSFFQWFSTLLEFVMPFICIEWWYSSVAVQFLKLAQCFCCWFSQFMSNFNIWGRPFAHIDISHWHQPFDFSHTLHRTLSP
jgi:hypothetical protein